MRGFIVGIIVTLSAAVSVSAQPDRYQEMATVRPTSKLYYEAFALPGGSKGALVTVGFRIPNDRLVFMRHVEGLDDNIFRASISVTAELYQDERIVSEKVWRSETFASDYEATVDPMRSTIGSVSFQVPDGEYGYRVRLNDLNSERTASTPIRPLTVPEFDSVGVAQAILADTVVNTGMVRYVTVTNLGGDARFGQEAVAVVPVSLDVPNREKTVELAWTLRKLDFDAVRTQMQSRRRQMESYRRSVRNGEEPVLMPAPPSLEGGAVVDSGRVDFASFLPIGPVTSVDVHGNRITLAEPGDSTGTFLVAIDLQGPRLENGTYVLDTRLEGAPSRAKSSTRFSMHWPDMPVSLLDIDVAIKNLRFIVDKSVVDQLKDGSREDKINKFKAFWAKRDPTPETAYNELMVEYYRRVDYAAQEYRTGPGTIPNGLGTDRARIYILHGPPEEISRSFPESGGVLETWVYSDGKTFTFESASSIDPFHIVREG